MQGYDEEPEATRKAIDTEGWLHPGDLATMRPDGYLGITGRAKDMIIPAGENIYPREVEEFLYTHPKVMDVYVLGLPNARWEEVVLGWIRLKPGETCTEKENWRFLSRQNRVLQNSRIRRLRRCFPHDGRTA